MMRVSLLMVGGALALDPYWVKTSNTEALCAAVDHDSNNAILIGEAGGNCTTSDDDPAEYAQMEVEGMVFIKNSVDGYLKDRSLVVQIEATKDTVSSSDTITTDSGAKIAYSRAGVKVGDANAGGFVGTASYLVLNGSLEYNKNDFLMPGGGEAKDVCVVAGAGTECGPKRKATAGDFKFSLYGYTEGAGFPNFTADSAFKYIGFLQHVDLKDMGNNPMVSFNNGPAMNVTDIGKSHDNKTDINMMHISGDKSSLSMAMPKDFLSGVIENGKPVIKSAADKAVIHAFRADEEESGFQLVYLFPLNDFIRAKGKTGNGPHSYFVYDPSVQSTDKYSKSQSSTQSAVSNAVTATVSILVAGLSMLLF